MKTVKLNKIKIQNFKGIASYEQKFNGNTDITADVMQGKSTIKEAYLFALGVDIDKFYPVDSDSKNIDGLEVNVELELSIDDLEYKISRGAKMKTKTDKETGIKSFDGFKKDMFEFDSIPCGAKEFETKLSDILGFEKFDIFKVLSVLNYFNEKLDWKERRELIYNLYVDNSKLVSLKEDEKYNLISKELKKGHSSANISTMLNSENNKIVDEKRRNEIILAEKQNELSNFVETDYDKIENDIKTLETKISKEKDRLEKLNINDINNEQLKKISELESELIRLEREDNDSRNTISKNIAILEGNVSIIKTKGIGIEKSIKLKTEEYKILKAQEYDNSKETCPTCKQTLPLEQIETIKEDFENYKKNAMGKLTEEVKKLKVDYETYTERLSVELSKLETYKEQQERFIPNELIEKTKNQIADIKKAVEDNPKQEVDTTKLQELKDKKNQLTIELGNKKAQQNCKNRIVQLIEEQKEITNAEILHANKRKQLEQYTLDIINLVNDSINANFNGIKFKLFEELTATAKKDIKETLVVTHNGVVYTSMSTGQKAFVNLEIVNTLQKTYGVNLPIFIDDGSITNIKELPNNQIIFLYNEKGRKLDNCVRIDEIYKKGDK